MSERLEPFYNSQSGDIIKDAMNDSADRRKI